MKEQDRDSDLLPCKFWFFCSDAKGGGIRLLTGVTARLKIASDDNKRVIRVGLVSPVDGTTCTRSARIKRLCSGWRCLTKRENRGDVRAGGCLTQDYQSWDLQIQTQRHLEIQHVRLLQPWLGSSGGAVFLIPDPAPLCSCSTSPSRPVPAPVQEAASEGRAGSGRSLSAAPVCSRPPADLHRRDTHL